MLTKKSIISAACACAAIASLSGCGDSTDEPAAAPAASSTTAAPAAGTGLSTAETPLGTVLTDGDGFTLYRFDEDSPGVSRCAGQCAEIWPPALGAPRAVVPLAGALGTVTRPDGATQATYDGLPLYRFAKDTEPGQTSGDGVKGTWHVITAGAAGG
ncbi:hypothetical protein O4215_25975 [Rhodococcus maanshanensis]|uniref:COG4315 family predicted lipoprotein n=1 Tax=Rhodococcus maanshanensis TaxID=183556 RepID=UPI0022B4638A|nr:hypothetical protein [Rhodococcus maanshanensis]MCZ4559016.1 hypothetical protein [Rhodococcus maanshanensis]